MGTAAFSTHVVGPIGIKETNTPQSGEGMRTNWLAVLDFDAPGNYVVSASATFWRRDYPNNVTARIHCTLGGLDQQGRVEFFVHPAVLEPDPGVTIPFNVAGKGARVFLTAVWNGDFEVYVRDIYINAIKVDQLNGPMFKRGAGRIAIPPIVPIDQTDTTDKDKGTGR